jgi:hypothetical protein
MLSPINSPAPTRRPASSRPAYGWDAGRSMAPLGLDRRYQTRATPSELAPAPPPNPAPLPPPPVHVRPGDALAAAVSDSAAARTKHLRTRSLTLSPVPTRGQTATAASAVTPERSHVRHCSDNSSSSGSVAVPSTPPPPPPPSATVNPYTMFGSNSDAAVAATRMALYCASPVYTRAENSNSSNSTSSGAAAAAARRTVTAAATAETPAHLRGRGTAAVAAAQQHSSSSSNSGGASLESGCLSPVRASAVAADATGAMTHQGLPRPVGKPQRVLYNPNAAKFCPAPQVFVPYSVTDAGNCSPRFIRPTVSLALFSIVYWCIILCLYL